MVTCFWFDLISKKSFMDPKLEKPATCFVCDSVLERDYQGGILLDGTYFRGDPGYGSSFDNTCLAEERLEIVICDGCLKEKHKKVTLVFYPRKPEPNPVRSDWDPNRRPFD